MKDVRTWLIIGLLIIVATMIIFDKDPEPDAEKIQALEYGIAIADQKIVQLTKDSTKLAQKIKSDSIRRENERKAYKDREKKQSAVIANLRANRKVVEIVAENPEIENLIEQFVNQDQLKTARIDTLESDLSELRVDMDAMRQNFAETLQLEREKFLHQQELTQEYKKQNRKLRRANRWLKVGVIAAGVGGLLLGQ